MNNYRTATIAILSLLGITGCQTSSDSTSGTHRMGTPKENYQMSNEQMPGRKGQARATSDTTSTSGTHRMGTPKENYQMSNEQMRR